MFSFLCSTTLLAQKIDFDFPGKENPDKHTEVGFTSWAVGRVASATKTFDNGVTITLTPGGAATSLGSNWSKLDVETNKLKLIGEEVLVTNLENGNLTVINDKPTSLTLNITGLTAGEHTLRAPLYDLQGRRIEQPAKSGVYIWNGKKFIVK